MNSSIRTCSLAMLAVALGSGASAIAQENSGFDVQFKARAGFGLEQKDQLAGRTIGMGLEIGYALAAGRIGCEVGFQYKPGDQYVYDWASAPVASDGIALVPALSGDNRRNSLQGLTLRVSYEHGLNGALMLRGGVQVGGAKFRQEVRANVGYRDPAGSAANVVDAYAGAFTSSGLAPSPFLGIGYRLGANSAFEFNLLGLSYKASDYAHVAGTGDAGGATSGTVYGYNNGRDGFEETSRMIPHIELGFVFRF